MASYDQASALNTALTVGRWLRNVRECNGLKQREIAVKLDMDSSHLSKLERSKQPPYLEQAEALAAAYEVPLAELKQRIILARLWLDCDGDPHLVTGIAQEAAATFGVNNTPNKL